MCTSVSLRRGLAMALSNAYRATRSTPNAVLTLSWVAISAGVPLRITPPAPVYGPSVPSRTTTMSTDSGRALASGVGDARVQPHRAQVDVVVEFEPQPQQQAALEHAAGHARVADRAEQDRVVPPDLLEHRVRQRLPGAVPAPRAEIVAGLLDGDPGGRRPQHLERLGGHLGTDSVAADDGKPDRS